MTSLLPTTNATTNDNCGIQSSGSPWCAAMGIFVGAILLMMSIVVVYPWPDLPSCHPRACCCLRARRSLPHAAHQSCALHVHPCAAVGPIPTKEGLTVSLETAIICRLDASQIKHVFTDIGTNYLELVIEPDAASAIRGLTSKKDANALYTAGRHELQEALKEELSLSLSPRGIIVEEVRLKDVQLPSELTKSIEAKAKAEQESLLMKYILQKEEQEAERKAIEATGIQRF